MKHSVNTVVEKNISKMKQDQLKEQGEQVLCFLGLHGCQHEPINCYNPHLEMM